MGFTYKDICSGEVTETPMNVRNSNSGNKKSLGDIDVNIRTYAGGSERPLLSCYTRCKCSNETALN